MGRMTTTNLTPSQIADLYGILADRDHDTILLRLDYEAEHPYTVEVEIDEAWAILEDAQPPGPDGMPFSLGARYAAVEDAIDRATREAAHPGGDWTAVRVREGEHTLGQITTAAVRSVEQALRAAGVTVPSDIYR
jgi:hypothetical protein